MNKEMKAAKAFLKDLRVIVKKYQKEEHIRDFTDAINRVAGAVARAIEAPCRPTAGKEKAWVSTHRGRGNESPSASAK